MSARDLSDGRACAALLAPSGSMAFLRARTREGEADGHTVRPVGGERPLTAAAERSAGRLGTIAVNRQVLKQ